MMNGVARILFVLSIIFFYGPSVFSQAQKPQFTSTQIYDFFEQFSPKDIADFTNSAASYFSDHTQKLSDSSKSDEEALADQLLVKFRNNSKMFNSINTVYHPYTVLLRCDQFRIVAHPIKEFFAVMSQPGFIKIYKDVNGKKIGVDLCEKVAKNKQGIWGYQKQWWPLTDKPLTMGVYTTNVGDSIYQVQSYYPTQKYSEEQLNTALE